MRRQNTEPLKAVINRYLKAIGADKKLKEIRLVQQWENIIGRNIARATDDIFIKSGILFLKFNSPVVKHEVLMIKQEILKKMNDIAEEKLIYDIRII